MGNDELKRCPFCGGKAKVEFGPMMACKDDLRNYDIPLKIGCCACGARIDGLSVGRIDDNLEITILLNGYDRLVEKWNNRVVGEEGDDEP